MAPTPLSVVRGGVSDVDDVEQLSLPVAGLAPPPPVSDGAAIDRPVARVVIDVPLPHLDRSFDYLVPEDLADRAVPGARVSVRFAGRLVAGFVVERVSASDHDGALAPLRRVVSPVPVLTPEILAVARRVAEHYAGTVSDVLRLAVPPRHARVEASFPASAEEPGPDRSEGPHASAATGGAEWADYEGGTAFLRHLAAGHAPRAVWSALPDGAGRSRRRAIAAAVATTLAAGRGALVVVPAAHESALVAEALRETGVEHVRLVAEDGPAARYRSFLRVVHGQVRVVVGTRAALFAPVRDLGLVVLWDDGDDVLAEPRAPYPQALRVARIRAEVAGAAALVGAYARSAAAHQLVADGWARSLQAPRPTVRARAPRVSAPDDAELAREGPAGRARIPHPAWELVRDGLRTGPVLVQVARTGYVPVTACRTCRAPARCPQCNGPLSLDRADRPPSCAWCGRPAADHVCPVCGDPALRAVRLGSTRTAEELGRSFPGVPVTVSSASAPGGVVHHVDGAPRLVVATAGAEPEAVGSYAAALLLDAAALSGRPELWAGEEALRRWMGAAALVRPAAEGGRVLLLGHPAAVPAQAFVRWDPTGHAERELAERAELRFPPAVALAAIQGGRRAVTSFLRHLGELAGVEVLGPVPVPAPGRPPPSGADAGEESPVRAILRADRADAARLSRALHAAAAARSARKERGAVRVQVDAVELW